MAKNVANKAKNSAKTKEAAIEVEGKVIDTCNGEYKAYNGSVFRILKVSLFKILSCGNVLKTAEERGEYSYHQHCLKHGESKRAGEKISLFIYRKIKGKRNFKCGNSRIILCKPSCAVYSVVQI